MIRCPACQWPVSLVLVTEPHTAGIRRRRQCAHCGTRFTTLEAVQAPRRGRPPGGGGTTLPAPTPKRRTGPHRSKES